MKIKSVYVYPAIFTSGDDGTYSIRFPDIENCFTCGNDIEEGMKMAEDVLALMIYTNYEESGIEVPVSTHIKDLELQANEFATYVKCDTSECRRKFRSTKSVKKTLTIPSWLNEDAMKAHLNFSKILQDALIATLIEREYKCYGRYSNCEYSD